MASFRPEISSRPRQDGLHVLYIRVTVDRKMKRLKTDIALPEKDFNPKAQYGRWIRASQPRHAKYNKDLENLITTYKDRAEALTQKGLPILENIHRDLESENKPLTVQQHFDSVLKSMESEFSYIYWKGVKSKLTRFAAFVGPDTPLTHIDTHHIRDFKTELIKKELSNVTVNNILKRIRYAFIPAIRANLIEKDPFRANDTLTELPSKKPRLTDEQIRQMEALDLSDDPAQIKSNGQPPKFWKYHTRNMYLFSYYNAGIRIADLMQLRHLNITPDGRLEYEMNKTGHRKSIALNRGAIRILALYQTNNLAPADYIFPILDQRAQYFPFVTYEQKLHMGFTLRRLLFNAVSAKTTQVNTALRELSKDLDLGFTISFHTARHSFADKARRSMKKEGSKVTLYDIKNALGHKSVVTTERYINSFDKESLDEAMGDIFD